VLHYGILIILQKTETEKYKYPKKNPPPSMRLLIILVFLVAASSLAVILTIQSETSTRYRCPNYIPRITSEILRASSTDDSNISPRVNNSMNSVNGSRVISDETIIYDSKLTKCTQQHNTFRFYSLNNQTKEITTDIFCVYNKCVVLNDGKDVIVFRDTFHILTNPSDMEGFGECVCISDYFVFVGYTNNWNRIAVFKRWKSEYVFSQFILFHNTMPFKIKCNDTFLVVVSDVVTIFKITKNEMFIPFQYNNTISSDNCENMLSDIYYDKLLKLSYIYVTTNNNDVIKYTW
jgi:hypothetical protein